MLLKERYINPLTDFGFKKLFGTEPNKELLIDFLNLLLPLQHQIAKLKYIKNEHLGANELDRKAIFDIYCESQQGEKFIVEVKKAKQNYFKDRSIYYASFPVQEQAQQGNWNYKLNAVYTIGILDFVFDEDKKEQKIIHEVKLKDQDCQVFYDKLSFIYIELPNFTKTETQLETHFDKWLYILRHLSNLQDRPPALQAKIFERLFKEAEIATFSKIERRAYEDSLKHYRDINNVVDTSIEKGRQQREIEIAKIMLQEGENIKKIIKYTQLPQELIQKIKQNTNTKK